MEEYDIHTARDIQDTLKDLLGETIKEMTKVETNEHLGYEKSRRFDSNDYCNSYKREHQKDISDTDQKIIPIYAKDMTTLQISETLKDIYGFETSTK